MNLKDLNFGHIKGFDVLTDDQKDEFIALHKEFIKHSPLHLRNKPRESNIVSVSLTRGRNYQVYFGNRSMVLLKTTKEKPELEPNPKSLKKATATKQVSVSVETHNKLKAQQEGKDIREIIDLACKYYWDK